MADVLDRNGLQLKTLTEIRDELVQDFQGIYGNNINVDQNSQDGQQLNIYAQGAVDLREILQRINAGFDPDQASGRILDQRVAINGISRESGTYTTTPVEITVDRALNLVGLDDQSDKLQPTVSNLYTVRDNAGTEFYLLDSISIVAPGIQSLTFRAAEIGSVEIQVNTITEPVTVISGVTNINNPSGALSIGRNEESDTALKIRRRQSVAIPSIGYLDGIEASLVALEGVVNARVYENVTSVIDSNGIPPHSIWAIVEGGSPTEIGRAIAAKKSSGSGMRGVQSVDIPRPNGSSIIINYDEPGSEDLYIRFSISLIGGGFLDTENVKREIVNRLLWEIGNDAGADDVIEFLKETNELYRVTQMEVSLDGTIWSEIATISSIQNRFVNDITRITIL